MGLSQKIYEKTKIGESETFNSSSQNEHDLAQAQLS